MTKQAIFRTALLGATAAAGYIALAAFAPDSAARIESSLRGGLFGWNAATCEASPINCLESRLATLRGLERSTAASTETLRGEVDRMERVVREQEELLARNTLFLDQGRAVFREREGMPDRPVQFAGRTYPSLAIFRAQLQLLFEEKAALEPTLASARELRDQMQARLDSLMVQAGQIALASRMVPGQMQLIQANRALGDFGASVSMIDGVIRGSEAGLTQSRQLIGTTRDLLAPSPAGRGGAVREAFEAFLQN